MGWTAYGLIAAAAGAGLATLFALHRVIACARGRRWEIAAWSTPTLAALGGLAAATAFVLAGAPPQPAMIGAAAGAPAEMTLALIARVR